MSVSCPQCGSRFLSPQVCRKVRDRLRDLVGISRLRCDDCGAVFVGRTWSLDWLFYARCPKCLRWDLNGWTEEMFHPTDFMCFRVWLGGHRYRCEYCRFCWVSFRKRKEKFSFDRWRERARSQAVSSGGQ